MDTHPSRGVWAASVLLAVSVCAPLNAATPPTRAHRDQADFGAALPVTAGELMPLEPRRGVYLVTAGPEKDTRVPFTFEQRGDRWVLTKDGLVRHELHRDRQGNLWIDQETDLRKGRQVEYASPVLLLPAMVDRRTLVTGNTRVTVRNARSGSVAYRGVCRWELKFVGVSLVETPAGIVPVYRLRARHDIRLPLGQMSVTIDFEYERGKGMVATGVAQMNRFLGLFTKQDTWRLEQLLPPGPPAASTSAAG